jgi:hypothetical protein
MSMPLKSNHREPQPAYTPYPLPADLILSPPRGRGPLFCDLGMICLISGINSQQALSTLSPDRWRVSLRPGSTLRRRVMPNHATNSRANRRPPPQDATETQATQMAEIRGKSTCRSSELRPPINAASPCPSHRHSCFLFHLPLQSLAPPHRGISAGRSENKVSTSGAFQLLQQYRISLYRVRHNGTPLGFWREGWTPLL